MLHSYHFTDKGNVSDIRRYLPENEKLRDVEIGTENTYVWCERGKWNTIIIVSFM